LFGYLNWMFYGVWLNSNGYVPTNVYEFSKKVDPMLKNQMMLFSSKFSANYFGAIANQVL